MYRQLLMEPEAVVVFRVADASLGRTVFASAQAKYKQLTGLEVALKADSEKFLPLESCGGLNVSSVSGNTTVINTLAGRLDNLLFKINPVIRIALYGTNTNRKFFDLSRMCGSRTLFRERERPKEELYSESKNKSESGSQYE